MKEVGELVLTLTKEGFPLWLIMGSLVVVIVFQVTQRYLTAFPALQTPIEVRRQTRVKHVTAYAAGELHQGMKELLEEERQRLLFLEITGIDASSKRREELQKLFTSTAGRYDWKDIRMAAPFLRQDQNGILKRGVHRAFTVFMWLFFFLFMATIGLGFWYATPLYRSYLTTPGPAALAYLIAAMTLIAIFVIAAGASFNQALPILRARQLQRWIPVVMREAGTSQAHAATAGTPPLGPG